MNLLAALSPNLKSQFEKLRDYLKNYTSRAYLVGGGVRDIVMQRDLSDLDIEVYDIDSKSFDEIMRRFGAVGVGKSFFVYKYGDIDISLPRVERKVGIGHKAFEVELCGDEKEAAKRRDFAMNAMMLDIFEYKLLDFYGGLQSIDKKVINLVNEKSFKEDSLRVLRALQFSARFGFKIEEDTLLVMDEIPLEDLSKTRIFWEFEKLFKAQNPHFALYYIYRLNLFEKLFTCRVQKELFCRCSLELSRGVKSFEKPIFPYYFIYIVGNILNLDIDAILKSLEAPRDYLRALKNQPYFCGDLSDVELKIVAMDIPINKWLGNYKKGIKNRAKELGIWDRVFDGGISVQDVIKDGFEKDEIKKEYRKRVLKVING